LLKKPLTYRDEAESGIGSVFSFTDRLKTKKTRNGYWPGTLTSIKTTWRIGPLEQSKEARACVQDEGMHLLSISCFAPRAKGAKRGGWCPLPGVSPETRILPACLNDDVGDDESVRITRASKGCGEFSKVFPAQTHIPSGPTVTLPSLLPAFFRSRRTPAVFF